MLLYFINDVILGNYLKEKHILDINQTPFITLILWQLHKI